MIKRVIGLKTSMDTKDLQYFKNWFDLYVMSFSSDDPELQRNFDLKAQHTQRVCREAFAIGKDLGFSEEDLFIAETTALFHDIGRFAQYKRYRTFSDRKSINHAELGVTLLRENRVLGRLEEPMQELILKVISYHNRATLPENEDATSLLFSRLLRDADKLDIWRVVTEYYAQKAGGQANETIALDLPDTPGFSQSIYDGLLHGQAILFNSMKNLNDFKLLQLGWVYDINFLPTLARLKQRTYLPKLQTALPDTRETREIFEAVFSHVDQRLKSASSMDAMGPDRLVKEKKEK